MEIDFHRAVDELARHNKDAQRSDLVETVRSLQIVLRCEVQGITPPLAPPLRAEGPTVDEVAEKLLAEKLRAEAEGAVAAVALVGDDWRGRYVALRAGVEKLLAECLETSTSGAWHPGRGEEAKQLAAKLKGLSETAPTVYLGTGPRAEVVPFTSESDVERALWGTLAPEATPTAPMVTREVLAHAMYASTGGLGLPGAGWMSLADAAAAKLGVKLAESSPDAAENTLAIEGVPFPLASYPSSPEVERVVRDLSWHIARWLRRHDWAREGMPGHLAGCVRSALVTYGQSPAQLPPPPGSVNTEGLT